ncbi:fibropellin-3-like [Littorina saxatilis]|uniref:fibropellin-3-like n=1 Tax=Littorina saxatilis TaxID=31220 RepID=UPI0038B5ED36
MTSESTEQPLPDSSLDFKCYVPDECVSDPCQNGATCVDQVNGYLCQCALGYTDSQCQTDIDECVSDPCQNAATCVDQVNGYLCQCALGYTDSQCQTDTDQGSLRRLDVGDDVVWGITVQDTLACRQGINKNA